MEESSFERRGLFNNDFLPRFFEGRSVFSTKTPSSFFVRSLFDFGLMNREGGVDEFSEARVKSKRKIVTNVMMYLLEVEERVFKERVNTLDQASNRWSTDNGIHALESDKDDLALSGSKFSCPRTETIGCLRDREEEGVLDMSGIVNSEGVVSIVFIWKSGHERIDIIKQYFTDESGMWCKMGYINPVRGICTSTAHPDMEKTFWKYELSRRFPVLWWEKRLLFKENTDVNLWDNTELMNEVEQLADKVMWSLERAASEKLILFPQWGIFSCMETTELRKPSSIWNGNLTIQRKQDVGKAMFEGAGTQVVDWKPIHVRKQFVHLLGQPKSWKHDLDLMRKVLRLLPGQEEDLSDQLASAISAQTTDRHGLVVRSLDVEIGGYLNSYDFSLVPSSVVRDRCAFPCKVTDTRAVRWSSKQMTLDRKWFPFLMFSRGTSVAVQSRRHHETALNAYPFIDSGTTHALSYDKLDMDWWVNGYTTEWSKNAKVSRGTVRCSSVSLHPVLIYMTDETMFKGVPLTVCWSGLLTTREVNLFSRGDNLMGVLGQMNYLCLMTTLEMKILCWEQWGSFEGYLDFIRYWIMESVPRRERKVPDLWTGQEREQKLQDFYLRHVVKQSSVIGTRRPFAGAHPDRLPRVTLYKGEVNHCSEVIRFHPGANFEPSRHEGK